jgi:SAM-dependent methyltransferase
VALRYNGANELITSVRIENDVVVGTSGGKYTNRNPLARYFVRSFDNAVSELAACAAPVRVLEVGCGEGHVTKLLLSATNAQIIATDLSATILREAERNLSSDRVTYRAIDVMLLEPLKPPVDMVVCCEVLEHLPDPEGGLKALLEQQANWYLFSVPREPIWRCMNMARGAYLKDFGNSPGHCQHWSRSQFLRFISQRLEPVATRAPIPWTLVLCRSQWPRRPKSFINRWAFRDSRLDQGYRVQIRTSESAR